VTLEWPVIYGDQVRDLVWWLNEEPFEARHAQVVWQGRRLSGNRTYEEGARLFQSTWTNPRPEVEITRLEFRIGETAMKPLVVAITAE
jgi:hypothetical protein